MWLIAERDQPAVTEALPIDTYPQSKQKPPITLPNPTYTVLCVTRYFKDKNWEQKIFYSPEAVALESKDMLFALKHEAKV